MAGKAKRGAVEGVVASPRRRRLRVVEARGGSVSREPLGPAKAWNDSAVIARAKAGDVAARNELIEKNLGLIRRGIWDVLGRGRGFKEDDVNEYLSVGVEAFVNSVRTFKPELGYALSTHALLAVRMKVMNARQSEGVICVPREGRSPSPQWRERVLRAKAVVSLDRDIGAGGGRALRLADVLSTVDSDRGERVERMHELMSHLGPREREILELRAGGMVLWQVAERLGVVRERIRQIEREALRKLRAMAGVAGVGSLVQAGRPPRRGRGASCRCTQLLRLFACVERCVRRGEVAVLIRVASGCSKLVQRLKRLAIERGFMVGKRADVGPSGGGKVGGRPLCVWLAA